MKIKFQQRDYSCLLPNALIWFTFKSMFFSKPKPTVTPEDEAWINEAFLWFEKEYGRAYLNQFPVFTPTREFFDIDYQGTEDNAYEVLDILCHYMDIRDVKLALHFFDAGPQEFSDESVIAQIDNEGGQTALGTYSVNEEHTVEIGIDIGMLGDFQGLVATMVHELSHLVLLGEGRLEENDEPLTDLNCIAMGFGIFMCNDIFQEKRWSGVAYSGWQMNTRGYIPEQVATYALALLQAYKGGDDSWKQYLKKSVRKMYQRNLHYLEATRQDNPFLNGGE